MDNNSIEQGKTPSKGIQVAVWGALVFVILCIGLLYVRKEIEKRTVPKLPKYGSVVNFELTNQLGKKMDLSHLLGKAWIADIIFTRCPGPCGRMSQKMKQLQSTFTNDVNFVTLTTDPEYDTVPVMKSYAEKYGADNNRWFFLTGAKSEIVKLARDGLLLTAIEKDPETKESDNDLFIHSTIFVLVDKRGFLRGTFESLEPGFEENVQKAMKMLELEK